MIPRRLFLLVSLVALLLGGETKVEKPYLGITHITRSETSPRAVTMHIVQIDLTTPGLRFKLTEPGGSLETVRQTTLEFLNQEKAQLAINGHFFVPFPAPGPDASLVGIAAAEGNVYSAFESPEQNYAIVKDAPGINIDEENHASLVHRDPAFEDGKHVLEGVKLWTTVSGSAQIITNGAETVPTYRPEGVLEPGGPGKYSNEKPWYGVANARTVFGLSEDNHTLTLFTVDRAGGSQGMNLKEVAALLIADYQVYNALNMDGGGSTTLAMRDAETGEGAIVNRSSDSPKGRTVASNLAIFAAPVR